MKNDPSEKKTRKPRRTQADLQYTEWFQGKNMNQTDSKMKNFIRAFKRKIEVGRKKTRSEQFEWTWIKTTPSVR